MIRNVHVCKRRFLRKRHLKVLGLEKSESFRILHDFLNNVSQNFHKTFINHVVMAGVTKSSYSYL